MKTVNNEALIKGVFAVEEAREVLTTLFRSKIQMHTIRSFGSVVRTGKESNIDNSRKQELIDSLDRLVKSINSITNTDQDVRLDCSVKMKFVKRKLKEK